MIIITLVTSGRGVELTRGWHRGGITSFENLSRLLEAYPIAFVGSDNGLEWWWR
jgi:hypothetical protein